MAKKIPKAHYSGEIKIGDFVLPCAVLEDHTRVISERGMTKTLGGKRGGSHWRRMKENPDVAYLPVYLSANNLKPFINNELAVELSEPLIFKPESGGKAYGLKAELVPEIFNVWLKARDARVLHHSQEHIAAKADILMSGLAHTGIIALVDEATGYQVVRARDELNKILEAYISKELLTWTKRFPDEFYKQMFRLWNWPYPLPYIKGSPPGPRYAGKLTRKLIYEKLPPGVLAELETINPPDENWQRGHKFSQDLTPDTGQPHLDKQIAVVTTLMRISPNKRKFEDMFRRAFPRGDNQLDLGLPEDDEDND